MNKLFAPLFLSLAALVASACGAVRPVAPSVTDSTRVEARTETVTVHDTAFVELPASWARDCAVAAVSLPVTKDAERAKRVERSTDAEAEHDAPREPALPHEQRYNATTPMWAKPAQSLAVWPPLKPTMSAPAAGTAASPAPGSFGKWRVSDSLQRLEESLPGYKPSRQSGGLPRSGDSTLRRIPALSWRGTSSTRPS